MSKFACRTTDGNRQVELDHPRAGEHLCVGVYIVTGTAQAVVKRDDALLTQDEVQKHWPEFLVAIKQELDTWVKYGCINRKQRKMARNLIDVKFPCNDPFD
ncbi:MAG: hypothetical protein ACKPKO_45005, partial [Candidatus Fonsibacter sp.]